jgi:hypothetical protein
MHSSSPLPMLLMMCATFTILLLYSTWPPLGIAIVLLGVGYLVMKFQLWLFSPHRHNPLTMDPFTNPNRVVVPFKELQQKARVKAGKKQIDYITLSVFDEKTHTEYISQETIDFELSCQKTRVKEFPLWAQPFLKEHPQLTSYLSMFIERDLLLRGIMLFCLPFFLLIDITFRVSSIFDYEFQRD